MKKWIFNNICVQSGKEKGCYCSTNYDFAILIDLSPKKVPSSNCHYIPAFLCRFQLRDQFDRAITNNKKTALRLLFLEEISSPPNWFLTVGRDWCWWKFVFSGEEPTKFLTAKTMIYHNKKGLMLMSGWWWLYPSWCKFFFSRHNVQRVALFAYML